MRWVGLAMIAFICACVAPAVPRAGAASPASTTPVAIISPSPSPTASARPIPARKVAFSCRLPISLGIGQGPQGEFIDFPSGRVTSDPKSPKLDSLVRPGRELHGYYVTLYFDRAYKRWLPVSRSAVSPDGAHYAYA